MIRNCWTIMTLQRYFDVMTLWQHNIIAVYVWRNLPVANLDRSVFPKPPFADWHSQQIWMAKTDRVTSILEMTQISQDFFGQLEWRHFVNIEYAKPLISKEGMSNLIAIIEPADGLAHMGNWTLKCYVLEEYYTLIFDDVNFDLYQKKFAGYRWR